MQSFSPVIIQIVFGVLAIPLGYFLTFVFWVSGTEMVKDAKMYPSALTGSLREKSRRRNALILGNILKLLALVAVPLFFYLGFRSAWSILGLVGIQP